MTIRYKKIVPTLLFFFFFSHITFTGSKVSGDTVENIETLAVSLIIDTSGSMSSTDSSKMRETAANIFIDLLSLEDNLGIISFSTNAIEVQPMSNIGTTGKSVIKGNLFGKLEADGDTDYQKAFQMAYEQLNDFNDQNVKKVIVFLTDGNPDPDPTRINEPDFMNSYMNSFWETIRSIGLKGYPVYTVGFGALDISVMDRIALETQGNSKVLSSPEEVAVEFFNVISQLKNRNVFLNESYPLENEKIIEFKMDEFVSQMTFVITNTPGEFGIELIPPEAITGGEKAKVENSVNYSLITLNQENSELSGTWKIKMTGSSQVSVLGAKDLFVKIWIKNPITNSQHSINDPISISAIMTGSDSDNLEVEGTVLVNGIQSLKPTIMTKTGDVYSGVIDDTNVEGIYEIILNLRDGENIISTTSAKVHVKVLPTLTVDISNIKDGFRLGEKRIVSSTLELGTSSLRESSELVLDYYNLIANYKGVDEVPFSLKDNGVVENGDAKADDGRFSTNVIFDKEGPLNLMLQVRGTYKGEIFILEKNIGDTVVYVPGSISVNTLNDSVEAFKGEDISLKFKFISTSNFDEVIELNVPPEQGLIDITRVLLGAGEEKVVTLEFTPAVGLSASDFSIPLTVTAENKMTKLEVDNLLINVHITTKIQKILSIVSNKAPLIILIMGVFLVSTSLIVLVGMILYNTKFKPLTFVTGTVSFVKIKDKPDDYSGDGRESIIFWKYRKSQIVITFNPNKEKVADFYIPGSNYNYDIIFERRFASSRFRFIDGYKGLLQKPTYKIFLRTTEPGIIILDNDVYTNVELNGNTMFNSGEFFFRYEGKKLDEVKVDNAKNILEGKM